MNTLKVKRLSPTAILPTRATEGDAGLDLYADENVCFFHGQKCMVSTGIAVEIPYGYVGLVHPRSGLAAKKGVTVLNTPGTIDAGYRGEVKVILFKATDDGPNRPPTFLQQGERIAQLVIQKVELPTVEEVEELSESVRGIGGFGSSGV